MISVKISILGQFNGQRAGWFDGLKISYSDQGETLLTGILSDQTALFGIISHLREMGILLSSVSSEDLLDQNPP